MTAHCDLLGAFSWIIQSFLLLVALSSLFVKRIYEEPKRAIFIWFLDTSKQACAAGAEHFINLFLASLFGGEVEGDPCVWYFLSNFMGFAFGTPFAFIVLKIFTAGARKFKIAPLMNTGVYNNELIPNPKISWWFSQLTMWLLIIVLQRSCMAAMFSNPWIHSTLGQFGSFVLSPVDGTYYARIVVVLVLLPFLINSAEFWVQDNFLMEQNKENRKSRNSISSEFFENQQGGNFHPLKEVRV